MLGRVRRVANVVRACEHLRAMVVSDSRGRTSPARSVPEGRLLKSRVVYLSWVDVEPRQLELRSRRLARFVPHPAAERDHGDPHRDGYDSRRACRPWIPRSFAPNADAPP